MLRFYLGAVQFALGDLPAPTLPSGKLTPAARAREKLGWRLGVTAYSFHKYTLFEAVDKTAELGLPYFGGLSFQKVSQEIPKNFDYQLGDDELEQIRLKLDSAGVRMLTYYIHRIPGDEAGCRRVFEFGRKMGIETFISEPLPEALDTIERFCDEYDVNLAIHNHGPEASPQYWRPEGILEACRGRSKRIGACVDLGYWMRSGIDPIEAAGKLGDRLMTLQVHDLNERGSDGHDVPWGTGAGRTEAFVREIHRLGIRPTMFGLEYSYDWFDSMPEMAACIEFFDELSLELAE
jgi:sugar phosphate isomerase/epimerase